MSILKVLFAQDVAHCGSTTYFYGAGQTSNINWPESGNENTFCSYVFKTPVGFYLEAKISYYLDGTTPSCYSEQYVAVSIDNMANWAGYSRFCGYRSSADPVVIQSLGNELKFGISSSYSWQYVNIDVEVLPLQQEDCECR